MTEKQVILAKSEYDQMELQLMNLREVVESRTISRIITPVPNYHYTCSVTYRDEVAYVIGTDENEALKEIARELEEVREENEELRGTRFEQGMTIMELQKEVDSWKKLPWYQRLFIKK